MLRDLFLTTAKAQEMLSDIVQHQWPVKEDQLKRIIEKLEPSCTLGKEVNGRNVVYFVKDTIEKAPMFSYPIGSLHHVAEGLLDIQQERLAISVKRLHDQEARLRRRITRLDSIASKQIRPLTISRTQPELQQT